MRKRQFRVLYREFLFRIVDLELLSAHAEGDSRRLLGQFASILIFCSVVLALSAGFWAAGVSDGRVPPLMWILGAWTMEHFLVATTMLVVGLFAVLSWESMFPDQRDLFVLGPLPVSGRTLLLAKVAAVGAALAITIGAMHAVAGLVWPFALASSDGAAAPALIFEPALPPLGAAELPAVMDRDIAPMLARLDLAAADGRAGIVIGVSSRGARRVIPYGAAKADSLFEIGSITKTFTGLLLAQMALQRKLDLRDPVRDLLPPGTAPKTTGFEITLLDLATHHSGLPRMPDNAGPGGKPETYTEYRSSNLYDFVKRHGLVRPSNAQYLYSNLGFTLLGEALASRAQAPYPELLRREITGPLGLGDTTIALSPEQQSRFLPGHDSRGQATPQWQLDAFASAGGLRSTAGDILSYLDAQLHPEATPLGPAILSSQRLRARVSNSAEIGLAWQYHKDNRVYAHGGATGGFTSFCFFDPRREIAGVVLTNTASAAFPFADLLGMHVLQRLAGEPALSLAPVTAPRAGPLRSFAGYWITMIAAGVFVYCSILSLQGCAAQLLPRRWFLRASAFLQLAVFCAMISGYFLQRSPASVLVAGSQRPWLSWIPSYWFVGLYQQLSGSLHPALTPFARRAWIGLAVAVTVSAICYTAAYLRTMRKVVEEPDLSPAIRGGWLPRFGAAFETALVQFSIRSLLRSRQHRMIYAFYLGAACAFAILFLNAPPGLAGPERTEDPWRQPSVPLIASTFMLMGFSVIGARVAFSLPLDLGANWIFRVMPFAPGPACLRARRVALYALSAAPAWTISAIVVAALWPWRAAAVHLALLGCIGIVLAEFSTDGVLKLPFTCSYLPGRSNLHVTFPLVLYMVVAGVVGAAVGELKAMESARASIALVSVAVAAALWVVLRARRLASPDQAELRFEEEPPDRLVSMDLG